MLYNSPLKALASPKLHKNIGPLFGKDSVGKTQLAEQWFVAWPMIDQVAFFSEIGSALMQE